MSVSRTKLSDRDDAAKLAAIIVEWSKPWLEAGSLLHLDTPVEGDAQPKWLLRFRGEEREFIALWLTLRQRTLHIETELMPAPEENHATFYEHLLRRNERLVGAHFSIGVEDAVFLRGEVPVGPLCQEDIDRVLGSLYAYVEQCFRPALSIGFASRFTQK